MKDRMIREAWDTLNPTAEQKERMRCILEAYAEASSAAQSEPSRQEETPSEIITILDFTLPSQSPYSREPKAEASEKKTPKKRSHTSYEVTYTGKKTTNWAGIAAAAVLFLMVAIGGIYLGLIQNSRGEDPHFVSPTATDWVPVTEKKDLPKPYQSLIDQYVEAIEEKWDMNRCDRANLSQSLPNVENVEDLGYTLRDLDGNGVEELIVTDGVRIYALYTLDLLQSSGKPKRLISGPDYETYTLTREGSICLEGVLSSTNYYYYLCTVEGTGLRYQTMVVYDYDTYPDDPWYQMENGSTENQTHLSQEEAMAILETFPGWIYISHTPFTGEALQENFPDEASFPVYAQALRDWEESHHGSLPTTYAFHDFDGDGEQELIIGEGDIFLRVVKNVNGTAQMSIIDNGNSNSYLCEDAVLLTYVQDNRTETYMYSKIESLNRGRSTDYLVHDTYKNTWTWKEHESVGLVTEMSEEEAREIIGSHPKVKLKWRSITEFPGIDQLTVPMESDQLLALYAQAIPEALRDYSKAEDQTFCFHDIDDDGKTELLLGAGNSVYRILQPRTGNENFIDISAPTGEQSYAYLCQGNVFETETYAQGSFHYQYFKIGDADGTMETEQIDYIFYSPETECWYLGGPGINTPILDEKAQEIRDSHPRVTLDWQHISDFPVAITGNIQSGTALFEKIFMGMAQGEVSTSKDGFLVSLQYYNFTWKETEGFIEVQDPENSAGYLSAELTNRNGPEEVYILDYVAADGGQQRIASIQFTQEGKALTIAANSTTAGKTVDAPEDLRTFIQGKDEAQLLDVLAREFTLAYFHQDWNYLRQNLTSDFRDPYVYTDGNAAMMNIHAIKGTDQIVKGGAYLSAECLLSPDSDAYVYLTMEFVKENGCWKVCAYGLEG